MVSSFKAFCFLFKPFNETFWNVIFVGHLKMERLMNIILYVLNFGYCFSLKTLLKKSLFIMYS